MTIVDVEQLGGAITEQLAALFDEEPRRAAGRMSATLQAPRTMQGPTPAAVVRRSTAAVADALGR